MKGIFCLIIMPRAAPSSIKIPPFLDQANTDSGTIWEVGYAYGIGKPILGIRTDFRAKADSFRVTIINHHACTAYIEFMEEDMRGLGGKIVKELEWIEEMRLRNESMRQ